MNDKTVFKISLPGYDVKTATPEQCSIHSGYDTLKIKLDSNNPQFGNVLVTFSDNPAANTYTLFTVSYNYGYVPACYFYNSVRNSYKMLEQEVGNYFQWDALASLYFQVLTDNDKMTFQCVVTPTFVANVGTFPIIGQYFAFRYYIFANDGA